MPGIRIAIAIVSAAALFGAAPAQAASDTWKSTVGGGAWETTDNWVDGNVPGATSGTTNTDTATFSGGPSGNLDITLAADRNIGSIAFTLGGVYRIGSTTGFALLLSAGGSISADTDLSASKTINAPLQLFGDYTFRNDASNSTRVLTISGGITRQAGPGLSTITLRGTNTGTNIFGGVTGDGNGQVAVTKMDAGTWRVGGQKTYTGVTTILGGVLEHNASLGNVGSGGGSSLLGGSSSAAANLVINGGTLAYSQVGSGSSTTDRLFTIGLNGATIAVTGDRASQWTNTGALAFSGAGSRTLTLSRTTVSASPTITSFSPAIGDQDPVTGKTSLVKSGVGDWTLAGNNTYTGNTTVQDGTLFLADGAGLKFAIGANGVNNQITGLGSVTLDGNFTFDLSGASSTVGHKWLIVDRDSLAAATFGATFSVVGFDNDGGGLWSTTANGATYQFKTDTGYLAVIPEPGTWAMLLGGFGVLMLHARRRQRS